MFLIARRHFKSIEIKQKKTIHELIILNVGFDFIMILDGLIFNF